MGSFRLPRDAHLRPLLLGLAITLLVGPTSRTEIVSGGEVRALWVLRGSLTSPRTITDMVRAARAAGFNTLLVQARGRGDSYFNDGVDPRAVELATQLETFDPLQAVIDEAHLAGLRVHAWINVNLVASAVELPSPRAHVIYRHPDWLMVPRPLGEELALVDPTSPAYVGKLARWTRARSRDIEGLYLSPAQPAAATYTVSILADLVTRYRVDGVHLDYIRYPSAEFDYSRNTISEFVAEVGRDLSPATRDELRESAKLDLFAFPDALPERWSQFRRSRLTSLVMRLRTTIKHKRPDVMLTAAVVPNADEAYDLRLQDWRVWLQTGILDAICPMAYTPDPEQFAGQIALARDAAGPRPVWAGIGAYRLSFTQTLDYIRAARRLGAAGVVLYSYDSLTNPSEHQPDYLAQLGRAAFAPDVRAISQSR
ncbi:MAG: family 10 glycosylhydrolase [Acidobacteria bacterium]|nr:family 10 glycosylhydrolase [Acidobacteriota bacterium]